MNRRAVAGVAIALMPTMMSGALTGEPVELSAEGGKWHLPVQLPAGVGGRVIQIRSKMGGQPFAEW